MERAQETAAIIVKSLTSKNKPAQAKPRKLAELNECDFGKWTGRKLSELRKLPEWQNVQKNPSSFCFPDGESFHELQARMIKALNKLATRHPGETIVAVSHADPIKAILGYYLGAPLDMFQRIMISPASISSILMPAFPTKNKPAKNTSAKNKPAKKSSGIGTPLVLSVNLAPAVSMEK